MQLSAYYTCNNKSINSIEIVCCGMRRFVLSVFIRKYYLITTNGKKLINTYMIDLNKIQENFPFLSCVKYQEVEYVCIIQNVDNKIISFYDFEAIRTPTEKQLFLECGDTWWWESNRMLPINIFLPREMRAFRACLKTLAIKDAEVMFGPVTSLNNLIKKRIKKRQIQLVKKCTN